MLRSYQYTQKSYLDYSMQNEIFHKKEIGYVEEFAHNHPYANDNLDRPCPMCGCLKVSHFFMKWGIPYLRCDGCGSLFALCDPKIEEEFLNNKALNSFRLSDEYQQQITDSRKTTWEEFLEWLEVRSFRFLRRNKNLSVIDIGNRLSGFVELIRDSELCGEYMLVDSILPESIPIPPRGKADIVLCNDFLKTEYDPSKRFSIIRDMITDEGLLVIGARAGSGFDVLTLKQHNSKVVPFEHILLPSVKGMVKFLSNHGFEVLEITTPGVMDVKYVMDCIKELGTEELFVQTLLTEADESIIQEFQRFLQKSCMSSLIRVIARRIS